MHKRIKGKRFSRRLGHRRALFRNLATDFFKHGEIQTTVFKAKALRPFVEKLITKARRGKPSDLKIIQKVLTQPHVVKKLVEEIAPQYKDRKGGYTQVLKLGPRKGDGVEMAVIRLV